MFWLPTGQPAILANYCKSDKKYTKVLEENKEKEKLFKIVPAQLGKSVIHLILQSESKENLEVFFSDFGLRYVKE